VDEILKLTVPMRESLDSVRDSSSSDNLSEAIFNWIVDNIKYDRDHGKFFYRTARETFNDGHGICGELAVVYMAFLRACDIDAQFVEVTKDYNGEEMLHACVMVKQNHTKFLSDPAYKSFVIKHKLWDEWTDDKLLEQYKSWNQ
jgi:hypothetical protein